MAAAPAANNEEEERSWLSYAGLIGMVGSFGMALRSGTTMAEQWAQFWPALCVCAGVYAMKWLFFGAEPEDAVAAAAAVAAARSAAPPQLAAREIAARIADAVVAPSALVELGCGPAYGDCVARNVVRLLRQHTSADAIACVGADIDAAAIFIAEEAERTTSAAERLAFARVDLRSRRAHKKLLGAVAKALAPKAAPLRTSLDAASGEELPPPLVADQGGEGGEGGDGGGSDGVGAATTSAVVDAAWDVDLLASVLRPWSDSGTRTDKTSSGGASAVDALRDSRAVVREVACVLTTPGALWVSVASLDGRYMARARTAREVEAAAAAVVETKTAGARHQRTTANGVDLNRFVDPSAAERELASLGDAWEWGDECNSGGAMARCPFELVSSELVGEGETLLLVTTLRRRCEEPP